MNILIFSKDTCQWCDQAKNLMNLRGIEFEEVVIGKDIMVEQFIQKYPGVKSVPYIIIDNEPIGGYKELCERIQNDPVQFLKG